MVKMHDAKLTQIEKAAQEALTATAKEVLKRARVHVPRDSSKLSRSGKIEQGFKTVSVVFRAPYAWLQHERLDYKHTQGRAKYLETAADEVGVAKHVVDGVRARLR